MPSKRKLIVFSVLLLFILFYLPVVRCQTGQPVKEKFCHAYGLCETDIYYSLSTVWREGCPRTSIPLMRLVDLSIIAVASAYLAACAIDWYYARYRDI